MRILVAEDELISREILTDSLKTLGHDLIVVQNGQDAWDILKRLNLQSSTG